MVEHQPMVLSASKCCSKCRHLMPAYIGDALQGHCALDNHEIGVPDGEVCDRFAAYVPTSGGVEIEPETD